MDRKDIRLCPIDTTMLRIHSSGKFVLLAFAVLALRATSLKANAEGGLWLFETIDATAQVSNNPSLIFDTEGIPHVAYYSVVNNDTVDVRYATKEGGIWEIKTVATANSPGVGDQVSIVLDGEQEPHITYHMPGPSGGNGMVTHAKRSNGQWESSVVHPPTIHGRLPDIILSEADVPFVALHDNGGEGFGSYVSVFEENQWRLDPVGDIPIRASSGRLLSTIALDGSGNVHLAGSEYANNSTGSWELEAVPGVPGDTASLVLNSHDQTILAFVDVSTNEVVVASRDDAGWSAESVAGNAARFRVSLELNQQDMARISFIAHSDSGEQLMWAASKGVNDWGTQVVSEHTTLFGSSLAIDAQGLSSIAYGTDEGLLFAVQVPELSSFCYAVCVLLIVPWMRKSSCFN